ncbi:MAG TPA: ADOP family duplicated permease [Gemmatimonadaceae bacterium]
MRDDVIRALRSLAMNPSFVLMAIGSLALGIGASTAVFSVLNAVYFSPLPFHPAGRLAVIQLFDDRAECRSVCRGGVTNLEFENWSRALPAADELAGLDVFPAIVADRSGSAVGQGAAISSHFLALLGIRPAAGRLFDSNDKRADAEHVVVLSHTFWVARYGADTAVIGSDIALNGSPFRIIGILPSSARIGRPLFTADSSTAQFFIPFEPYAALRPDREHALTLIARLRPGSDVKSLHSQMQFLLSNADHARTSSFENDSVHRRAGVLPLRRAHARAVASSSYFLLLGSVAFVLLSVCANLAGLFVVRFHGKRHDLIVRAALGATRWKQVRQLCLEALICAAGGGALGLAISIWLGQVTKLFPASSIPYWTNFSLDPRVLGFAAGLVALTAVLVGAAPVIAVRSLRTASSLRDINSTLVGVRDSGRHRLALIALEVQIALVLLSGASLFAKAFVESAGRDIGRAKQSVFIASISTRGAGLPSVSEQQRLAERILYRLHGIPGVVGVAANTSGPSFPGLSRTGDRDMTPVSPPLSAELITPEYFDTWRIPLVAGRAFNDNDAINTPAVAILDEQSAKQLFPAGHILGQQIRFGSPSSGSEWMTIVGVVGTTARGVFPDTSSLFYPTIYQPLAQNTRPAYGVSFVVRTSSDARGTLPAIRAAIHDVAPNTPIVALTSIAAAISKELGPLRLNFVVLSVFAIISLTIAAVGVFGVVSQVVERRSPEIGLRIALGAQAGNVLWFVMRSTLIATVLGVLGGLAGSFALTGLARRFLYGGSAMDPRILLGASAALLLTSLAAAYFPARRAMRIDPSTALRNG